MIKQSKPNKITTIAEIKWQRLREERCKHKDNTAMCYRRGNWSPRCKASPPPSKRSIIHKRMKLGYMNSKRPSKPNLPSVPKPFKLLSPMRLCRTFFFSDLPDPAICPIASNKPHRLLLAIPQSFSSSKTLSTLWIGVCCVWV